MFSKENVFKQSPDSYRAIMQKKALVLQFYLLPSVRTSRRAITTQHGY